MTATLFNVGKKIEFQPGNDYFVSNWYVSTRGFSAPVTEVTVARWIYELNNKHPVLEDYITSSVWSHQKKVASVFLSVFTILKSQIYEMAVL